MNHPISGVIPALPTPLLSGGGVNAPALRALIEFLIENGCSGFYVGGSSAEAFLLTPEERLSVYEIAADAAAGRVAMIAHVGAIATDDCVRYARRAKECGYDVVSAVSPFYFKFSPDQIAMHYRTIADAAELPMLVYNIPALSGVNLTTAWMSEMLSDSRFLGVKFTSSDFFGLERLKTAHPDKVVLSGYDEMFLAGLSMGADGGIGSTYNFMPQKFVEIRRHFLAGEMQKALEIQRETNRIIEALLPMGIIEVQKEVLCQMGFDFGTARAPFATLTDAQKETIRREITSRL